MTSQTLLQTYTFQWIETPHHKVGSNKLKKMNLDRVANGEHDLYMTDSAGDVEMTSSTKECTASMGAVDVTRTDMGPSVWVIAFRYREPCLATSLFSLALARFITYHKLQHCDVHNIILAIVIIIVIIIIIIEYQYQHTGNIPSFCSSIFFFCFHLLSFFLLFRFLLQQRCHLFIQVLQ